MTGRYLLESIQPQVPKLLQGTAACPNPDHPSAVSPPCFGQPYPSLHPWPSPVFTPGVAGCQHRLPPLLFSWLCTWHWKAQTNTVNICIYAFVCLLTGAFPEETRITVVQDYLEWCELMLLVGTSSLVEPPTPPSIFLFQNKPEKTVLLQLQPRSSGKEQYWWGRETASFWWAEPASPARMEKARLAWCPSWVMVLGLQQEALSKEVIA